MTRQAAAAMTTHDRSQVDDTELLELVKVEQLRSLYPPIGCLDRLAPVG